MDIIYMKNNEGFIKKKVTVLNKLDIRMLTVS